ncbi:MAG: isoleucine--tRNA ligase [bacterium]|nr:isoleucine--tRNA ligase [bacterium]
MTDFSRKFDFKKIEEDVAALWDKEQVIKKTIFHDKKRKLYAFLEGPPTANAPPALHHVEMRVFKDLFCRFKYMQGYSVPRKGGWDCHGLPVEVQAEKKLGLTSKQEVEKYGINKFAKMCRTDVFSYIKEWEKLTSKMAFWVDLKDPYVTLDNNYIESVWWSLKELFDRKLLYESHKVVPYCPRCQTPLSSHEVAQGYSDVTEDTITCKFRIKGSNNRYFLAWTTTPWTLPSNLALAVSPKIDYAVVSEKGNEYVLARDLVPKYFENPKIVETIKGKDLVGAEYEPLFDYFVGKLDKKAWVVIPADYVTTEEGTGIVHQAPAFGEDDYEACKKHDLAFVQPIKEDGHFTEEVTDFAGMFVKDADKDIIELLDKEGLVFKQEKYTHSYPFCWRCSSALIYFAMKSWFIKITAYKSQLIENNKKINWYPNHIKDGRFGNWLESAKDWALSRTKFWGTPLPIWRCECGKDTVIGSIEELRKKGIKVPKEVDLHKPVMDNIKIKCSCGKEASRVPDVIDCWYDSGSASFAQYHYPFENKEMFKASFPYQFIAEAIDQTRGWFYTLHALGTLLFDSPAYMNVVCAGHVVDDKGEKMSKSKGNVINPWEIFDKAGVDAVRLQMCTTAPETAKRFGDKAMDESTLPFINVLWNSCYFASSQIKKTPKPTLKIEDKWIISRANSLAKKVTEELENHNYHLCTAEIKNFVNEDFSRWYIKLIRARKDSALSYTFYYVINHLSKIMAPFMPYTSEYLFKNLLSEKEKSVHLAKWPKPEAINAKLEERMIIVREIVQSILSSREKMQRNVRWPIKEGVLETKNKNITEAVKELSELIKQQTNIKEIVFKKTKGDFEKAEFTDGVMLLNTELTPELEAEGYSRELIRRIQNMRKFAGLKKEDIIELHVKTAELKDALEKNKKQIMDTVGAKKLEISADAPTKKQETEKKERIKGKEIDIFFSKVYK